MYKSKKNNIWKNVLKFMSLLMTIFFSLIWVSYSWEASVTPLNILNKRVNSANKSLELNSLEWKAIVKDLYSNSLKQIELVKINPMLESVKSTTTTLNNNYLCSLNDNDTINILYKSNDDFRKNLRNLSNGFKTPIKKDMIDSCEKLISCILSTGSDKKILDSLSYCKLIVNDYYTDEYKNSYNIWSLTEGNKWSDVFRNNTLSDGSYDILNDIYVLARILFDTAEEPAEMLFYDMPNIWPAENLGDLYISMINNRFSPYYQQENAWWPNWWSNNVNEWHENNSTWTETTEIVVDWELWDEIIEFTQTMTHEIEWKDGYEFLWNDCIDEFSIEWYDGYTYTESITWSVSWNTRWYTEYIETIIENINNLMCEYDENCNTWSWISWNSQWWIPQWLLPDIDIWDIDLEKALCIMSCNEVPCNATSCDRLACYAKCLCISYESPFFDPIEHPWLWPIFKLKFCIQPVQDHKVVSKKKASTLESVVNEINTVIQDLRNSWELMLNKKTKELLDAGLQKNDFSKQISFTIDWFQKTPVSKQSEKQQKETQINYNTSLMTNILWFEKEETVNWNWRNKYIVKWWAQEQWNISSTQQENIPVNDLINDSDDIIWSLKSSHINNMWSKVYNFLKWNLEFWQSFKEAMDSLKGTAQSLADKK